MRARTIVVIMVVAIGLGLVTGWLVLPGRSTLTATSGAAPAPSSSPSRSTTPTPSISRRPAPTVTPLDTPSPTPTGRSTVAPTAGSLDTKDLLNDGSFYQQGVMVVDTKADTKGTLALSACSGEETMRDLTKGKASAYAEETLTFDTSEISLTESVAETTFGTSADEYETRLKELVRGCQDEPAGHWHYGKENSIAVKGGAGTWYSTFDGDGKATGGIAVIRSGRKVGVVELTGQPSDDPAYMQGIAATSINQLAN